MPPGVLLDDGGVVDVQAVGVEHGALGARLDRRLIDAAGHVDGGDVGLGHGDERAGLLGGDAAGLVVGAVDAQLHQEVGAHRFPDGLQNLEGEAGAVLQRAAVAVGAGVHQGGEELGEEEAVAAVDEHAVKARLLHVGGGDGEVAGDAGHVVLVHGADPHAGQIGGLDGANGLLPGAEGHLLLAAVDQLGQSDSAVALDAAGILAHGVEGLGILLGLGEVKGTEAGDTDGVGEVDVGLAHDDAAVAALGAGLQLAVGEVPGVRVLNNEAEGHGGADDAVAVGHLTHLHGGKQMLEFHDNQTPSLDAGELDALVLGQALGHQLALGRIHEEAALGLGDLVAVNPAALLGGAVTLQPILGDDEFPAPVLGLLQGAARAAHHALDGVLQPLPLGLAQAQGVGVAVGAPAVVRVAQPLALGGGRVEGLHHVQAHLPGPGHLLLVEGIRS